MSNRTVPWLLVLCNIVVCFHLWSGHRTEARTFFFFDHYNVDHDLELEEDAFLEDESGEIEFAPVVNITGGAVKGLVEVAEFSRKVYLYRGIKYGEAKRFQRPTMYNSNWNEVYDATSVRFACPQPYLQLSDHLESGSRLTTNEDCLYLNVYQPEPSKETKSTKLPVMVWIHGGTFVSGSSFDSAFDSRYLASTGNVVVVTLNYRLGAFGFLLGDTDQYSGNLGLYDQILALQWVRANIEHFDGDPSQVTLFGESAGAMSVGALVLSPLASGLFHRVVMQSGSPNSFVGSESRPSAHGKVKFLGSFLDCKQSNLTEVVQCIESKSAQQIQSVTNLMSGLGQFFEPSYNTELLPVTPVEALKTGRFNRNLDILYGVNRDEGANGVYALFPAIKPDSGKPITVDEVSDAVSVMLQVFKAGLNTTEVTEWYTRHLNESNQIGLRNAVADVYGDFNLVCPTILFGEQYAHHSPNNQFYSYRLVQPITGGSGGCAPWMGVCHAMDLHYVFGTPIAANHTTRYSSTDYQLSGDVIRAWTSFAATGRPTPMQSVQWTQALQATSNTTANRTHRLMWLDSQNYHMVDNYFAELCDVFWKPKILA